MENHHHGIIIKKYRKIKKITQAELAGKWPTGPVNYRYIQKIESGERQLSDQKLLRQLSEILSIPLWELGLSEYNPFNPLTLPIHEEKIHKETLDVIDHLIHQTWYLRRVAPTPTTEKSVQQLVNTFETLKTKTPPLQLEKRYFQLLAQTQRLNAIIHIEKRDYYKAIHYYKEMYQIGKSINDATSMAIALLGLGAELERGGLQQKAVNCLEEARDQAFNSSQEVAALVHAYLARVYASNNDAKHFERAINTAQSIAANLQGNFGNEQDFAFYSISGILAEASYGYLEVNQPNKTMELRELITNTITLNQNTWLYAWIPLDWARAYMMTGEIEESIKEGKEFFHRAQLLQSPHAINRAYSLLISLEKRGYSSLQVVQEFREELGENQNMIQLHK